MNLFIILLTITTSCGAQRHQNVARRHMRKFRKLRDFRKLRKIRKLRTLVWI